MTSYATPQPESRRATPHARVWRTPEQRPMPATAPQVDDIRSVIRWAKTTKVGQASREAVLLEALEHAVTVIEQQPASLTAWIIGALHASLRKTQGMWIVTNRALHDEALDAIEFLHSRDASAAKPATRRK